MASRLSLVVFVWSFCAAMAGMGLLFFRAEPRRSDLYGLVIWPMLGAAVIATPFALFA